MSYASGAIDPIPGSALTLEQYIQQILAGLSGIAGTLVRPKYQKRPPKQPPEDADWVAFYITGYEADAAAYVGVKSNGISPDVRRFETLEIQVSTYGPNAYATAANIRDGFQLPSNRDALNAGNMGFIEFTGMRVMPDLVGENWIPRIESTLMLTRQVQRAYPMVSLTSLSGSIKANANSKIFNVPFGVSGQT